MEDTLYTTQEIAEKYNVSSWTVSQIWVKKQGLKCKRGRPNRFKLKWVDDFLEQQAAQEANKCIMFDTSYTGKGKIKNPRISNNNNLKISLQDII